jgi:hypothetical protein
VSLRNGQVMSRRKIVLCKFCLRSYGSPYFECGVVWRGEPRSGQALLLQEHLNLIGSISHALCNGTVRKWKDDLLLSAASSSNCHRFAVVHNVCTMKLVQSRRGKGTFGFLKSFYLHRLFPKTAVRMVKTRFKSFLADVLYHDSSLYLSEDKSLFSVLPKEKCEGQTYSEIHAWLSYRLGH